MEGTISIWSLLLDACRIYGNLEVAKCAAEKSLIIDPHDGLVYVLYNFFTCMLQLIFN